MPIISTSQQNHQEAVQLLREIVNKKISLLESGEIKPEDLKDILTEEQKLLDLLDS